MTEMVTIPREEYERLRRAAARKGQPVQFSTDEQQEFDRIMRGVNDAAAGRVREI
jgi:hypothetical protein